MLVCSGIDGVAVAVAVAPVPPPPCVGWSSSALTVMSLSLTVWASVIVTPPPGEMEETGAKNTDKFEFFEIVSSNSDPWRAPKDSWRRYLLR